MISLSTGSTAGGTTAGGYEKVKSDFMSTKVTQSGELQPGSWRHLQPLYHHNLFYSTGNRAGEGNTTMETTYKVGSYYQEFLHEDTLIRTDYNSTTWTLTIGFPGITKHEIAEL